MTSLATDVLGRMVEINAQVDTMIGWDGGVGVWNLHADEDDLSDLAAMKLGGPEHLSAHPTEIIRHLTVPPDCTRGLLLSFEGWYSPSDYDPPSEAPDRTDVRWLIAALRNGTLLVLEHIRGRKPRLGMMNQHRLLTVSPILAEVCIELHNLCVKREATDPIAAFMQALMASGASGMIIMEAPNEPNES